MRIGACPDGCRAARAAAQPSADADRRGDVRDAGCALAAGRAAHRDARGAGRGAARPGRAGRAPRPAGAGTEPRPRRDRLARARQAEPGRALRDDRERPPLARPAAPTPTSATSSPTPPTTGSGTGGLEDLVRDGTPRRAARQSSPDDPYWRSYIRGQYQLARLSSAEVAKAVPLRQGAHSLLDVAGAHGEYSMALCRRHEGLRATIVDLPGSARVGERDRRRGRDGRPRPPPGRRHVRGRLRRPLRRRPQLQHHPPPLAGADRGRSSPASAPCCAPARRSASSTSTTGPGARSANPASILGLFFHLTSGADTYTVEEVSALDARERLRQRRHEVLPDPAGPARC